MSRINFDIWRVIKQVLKWTVTAQSLHHNSAAAPHTAQSVSAFKDAHHDFYQTFEQHNKLDLELLEWAEAMFDSKFSAEKDETSASVDEASNTKNASLIETTDAGRNGDNTTLV
mmetsp:Transcript_35288/g.66535  ORF Transcript_35288/g.66535 Transcript_35288/m.66535 type:complete len:114 (+) Transcript_35288:1-342(+)